MRRAVYLVHGDVERYQSLVLPIRDEQLGAVPALGGHSVRDRWVAPPVISEDVSLPEPDVWHVSTLTQSFAMAPTVIDRLEPFISMAGELLPLRMVSGAPRELLALNVLQVLDVETVIDVCVDSVERHRMITGYEGVVPKEDYQGILDAVEAGDPWPLLRPAFREPSLTVGPTFFMIDRLAGAWFLHDNDDKDTLLRRIEQLDVTGLVFQRIWSSQTGPEPINLFRP